MFGKYKKNNYNRNNIIIILIGIKKENLYKEVNIELINVLHFKNIHQLVNDLK